MLSAEQEMDLEPAKLCHSALNIVLAATGTVKSGPLVCSLNSTDPCTDAAAQQQGSRTPSGNLRRHANVVALQKSHNIKKLIQVSCRCFEAVQQEIALLNSSVGANEYSAVV